MLQISHPALNGDYAIWTPPNQTCGDHIVDWLTRDVTGAYIVGYSRFGKSTMVNWWLPKIISENFGDDFPYYVLPYAKHSISTEKTFLTELLSAVGHNLPHARDSFERQQRLINFLCAQAARTKRRRVALIIDDAQYLSSEYEILANIQNLMKRERFYFTVISVGTHEIEYQKNILRNTGGAYLIARFMTHTARFVGINGARELSDVLASYDEQLMSPPGTPFTAFFFPKGYKHGLRMATYASKIWKIYEELAPAEWDMALGIPMEHVAKTIEFLFSEHNSNDRPRLSFTNDMLRQAIEQTGVAEHLSEILTIDDWDK
jgi:hypothetical protein